jgi:DNA-binding MarR family transcriptional regulator
LRPAHTALFAHIDLEGTRLTTVAARAGISKQAVGQLVNELVEMGALERSPDPEDGRAKLIRFAMRDGELSLMHGMRVLGGLEREIETLLGAESTEHLLTTLQRLDRWVDAVDVPTAGG